MNAKLMGKLEHTNSFFFVWMKKKSTQTIWIKIIIIYWARFFLLLSAWTRSITYHIISYRIDIDFDFDDTAHTHTHKSTGVLIFTFWLIQLDLIWGFCEASNANRIFNEFRIEITLDLLNIYLKIYTMPSVESVCSKKKRNETKWGEERKKRTTQHAPNNKSSAKSISRASYRAQEMKEEEKKRIKEIRTRRDTHNHKEYIMTWWSPMLLQLSSNFISLTHSHLSGPCTYANARAPMRLSWINVCIHACVCSSL